MATLDYEPAAATARTLGPFLFIPSVRTLILLLVAGASTAWVAARHEPWEHVATFPIINSVGRDRPWLSSYDVVWGPPGQLVVVHADGVVRVHDRSSGAVLREIHRIAGDRFVLHPLRRGAQVLVFDAGAADGLVTDVASGAVVRTTPNLLRLGFHDTACDGGGDGLRVVAVGTPEGSDELAVVVFDLSANAPPGTRPRALPVVPRDYGFADGGRYLVPREGEGPRPIQIFRADAVSGPEPFSREGGEWSVCTDHYWVWAIVERIDAGGWAHGVIEVGRYGQVQPWRRLPSSWPAGLGGSARSSHDGSRLHVITYGSQEVWDLRGGRRLGVTPEESFLIEGANEMLESGGAYGAVVIRAEPDQQPVAVIRQFGHMAMASPDGRSLVLTDIIAGQAHLLRRPGPECRPSRLGVLGMPHAWLLIAVVAGLMLSMAGDAGRRRTGAAAPPPAWLAWGLALPAGLGWVALLLALTLGQRPWALLLASGVLLAVIFSRTGSRFWRWALVVILAAVLCLSLEHLRRHAALDPRGWSVHAILDRRYGLPDALAPSLHAAAAALALAGLLVLLIPRPRLRRPSP